MSSGNETINWFSRPDMSPWFMFFFATMGPKICEFMLSKPQVQKIIESDQKFDLVISEIFLNEAVIAGFASKFQAPIVGVMPFMPNIWANYLVTDNQFRIITKPIFFFRLETQLQLPTSPTQIWDFPQE